MLNFYTSKYVYYLQGGWGMAGQGVIDAADTFNATNGTSIGPETASSWFKEVPWAFRKQLKWVSDRCARRPGPRRGLLADHARAPTARPGLAGTTGRRFGSRRTASPSPTRPTRGCRAR
jgi:hypothetical protein